MSKIGMYLIGILLDLIPNQDSCLSFFHDKVSEIISSFGFLTYPQCCPARLDLQYMRMVPFDRSRKGQQPLKVLDFLVLILNFCKDFKVKIPPISTFFSRRLV